jgi:hypothetical protein
MLERACWPASDQIPPKPIASKKSPWVASKSISPVSAILPFSARV